MAAYTLPTSVVAVALAMTSGGVATWAPSGRETSPQKLSDLVSVVLQGQPGAQSNVGIVIGRKATLVVDSGLGPKNGAILATVAHQAAAGSTLYVAATHFHPEHMMGESGFPASAIVLRSKAQQQDIDQTGAASGAGVVALFRQGHATDMEGAVYRSPDMTFDGDLEIDLGGTRVRLMQLGPAHTRGDLGFFVEGDNVVFTGDVAMSRPLGINADSAYSSAPTNASVWLASLERLTKLKPMHVVPSHGPLGDGSMIEKHRLFMTDVRDRVRMLKRQGRTADQVVSALSDELAKKHNVPEKVVADAARLFYAELG